MSSTTKPNVRRLRPLLILAGLLAVLLLLLLITRPLAHLHAPFSPDYPRQDLSGLLERQSLSSEDYRTLFLQTGLGQAAVDAYRAMGAEGDRQILAAQEAFFSPDQVLCDELAVTTWEDLTTGADGAIAPAFTMAPLEAGDVLLSFSTHTLGWRHGHAGLVVDGEQGVTLEAVVIGSDSSLVSAGHWSCYSTYLHLRLPSLTDSQRADIASFARTRLNGIPYHLTSGIFSPEKFQSPDSAGLGAQCAYLVWYALAAAGYDTDADGGRIVTVGDLSESPLFQVVQVYGLDPRDYMDRAVPA